MAGRVRRGRQRGQAVAEFALVIIVALFLLMGVIDIGRAIYGMNAMGNAARMGVRTAIVNQYGPDVRQRAADQAVGLGIDASGTGCPSPTTDTAVCFGIRNPVDSAACTDNPPIGCLAVVEVRYTFRPITPLITVLVPIIPLSSTSKQPIESPCSTSGCPVP